MSAPSGADSGRPRRDDTLQGSEDRQDAFAPEWRLGGSTAAQSPLGAPSASIVDDATGEEELRRQIATLVAEQETKDRILALVSHEVRTPLNVILGWVCQLRRGTLSPTEAAHAVEAIERNALLQQRIVGDLVDAHLLACGRLSVTRSRVALEEVLDQAVQAVRGDATAANVHLSVDVRSSCSVLGDPGRLEQVIRNLLVNAVKFTPPGGAVRVRFERCDAEAVLEIADTGLGIGPELLPCVFDAFRQGDSSLSRRQGGLGLGLTIARHIVDLHGGSLTAASEGEGRGATFTVRLACGATSRSR